jgi:AcrR family transcriptional regulator
LRAAVNNQSTVNRSVANRTAPVVRQHAAQRGGGSPSAKADRRVRRTRHALVQALIALVVEKGYKAITVQDLLDRANVGRSTFYSHYRNKDDLLLKSFEAMIGLLFRQMDRAGPTRRVAPVRELFQHVAEVRSFHQALERDQVTARQSDARIRILGRSIERRLAAWAPAEDGAAVPPALLAQALAGALFALLNWWVAAERPCSPETMDEIFHALRVPR